MNTEMKTKEIVANNLIRYRKLHGYTQADLAQKLNYTDKAISKWERAESLPDVVILAAIAALFHVSVDDLLTEHTVKKNTHPKKGTLTIALMATTIVWLIATTIYVLLGIFLPTSTLLWLAFIYAIPTTAIVWTILMAIWKRHILLLFSVSILAWTIPLSIYLSIDYDRLWLLFLIAIPVQLLVFLWFFFLYQRNHTKN